jgi:hypothetical protein
VREAHDRYANLELGFHTQRVEGHHSCVTVTSNLPAPVDRALFLRAGADGFRQV